MSYPTVLAPWYVVQQPADYFSPDIQRQHGTLYYSTDQEGKPVWTDQPYDTAIFMSLQSAARVAAATAGEVRVLTTKEELKEFRPEGEL